MNLFCRPPVMAPAQTACAVEDGELPIKPLRNPIKHPIPRMINLYNTLLEKKAPDMIRAATLRAAIQNAQALNVVLLKASQMLSA